MGTHGSFPSISEVVTFLETVPDVSASLESRGADYSLSKLEGITLGIKDRAPESDVLHSGLRVRAEVVAASLVPMVDAAEKRLAIINEKLKALNRLKFVTGVIAALAAPGSILLVLVDKEIGAVALSSLSFLSSLAQLLSSTLVLGAGRKDTELMEMSRELSSSATYGRLTSNTLAAMLKVDVTSRELEQILKEANQYFGALNDALVKRI